MSAPIFSDELVREIERIVDARVAKALKDHANGNGSSPWLGIPQAAEYVGISTRTLTRLLDQGRVQTTHVGRRKLVHRDDLDAHLRREG